MVLVLAGTTGEATAAPAPAPAPAPAAAAAAAAAAPRPPARLLAPYQVAWVPELALTVAMFAVVGVGQGAVNRALPGGHPCALSPDGERCDVAALAPLDRLAVGQHDPTWRHVSDAGMAAGVALPLLASLLDNAVGGSTALARDTAVEALVIVESVAAATFVNQAFKYAVRRPRPGLYAPGRQGVDGALSFPSGHAAATAAGAAAYAATFALRHPHGGARWAVAGGAAALTALTAYGRVAGGMHFPTDVMAGALLGAGIGVALPLLHPRAAVALLPAEGGGSLRLDVAI